MEIVVRTKMETDEEEKDKVAEKIDFAYRSMKIE